MRRAAALLALALSAGAAPAQEAAEMRARQAAADLARAAERLGAAEGAADRVEALTGTVRAYEDGLAALRDGLRQIAVAETALTDDLAARDAEIAALTGALLGMERSGAPLLLLHPSGPLGTARSAMMLGEAAPALQARADGLRADLATLAELRMLEQAAARQLEEGIEGIRTARAALSEAIAERGPLPGRVASDDARIAALLGRVDTLEAFADGLADLPAGPPPAEVVLPLALPAQGTLLRRFREADAAGIARPGLVLATAPGTLLSAPAAASVRYAGPLLDYGNVIIVEPRAGALLVFAGLAEVYARAGEIVAAGAPLGLMGGASLNGGASAATVVAGGGAARPETLYIEVREAGRPVDPATWFATDG